MKDGITKLIDGEVYYKFDYANFLYEELQKKDDEIEKYKSTLDKIKEWAENNLKDTYAVSKGIIYEEIMKLLEEVE